MFQYVLFVTSVVSLYLTLVWFSILYLNERKSESGKVELPTVSIAIPAHNESSGIADCILSVVNSGYPKDRYEIIVVNNASTDNTAGVVGGVVAKNEDVKITLVNTPVKGKAAALNLAIEKSTGEFFACVDADSRVTRGSIQAVIRNFRDESTAAAISSIKVDSPKGLLQRMQRIEYISSIVLRSILSIMGTLYITPGVLSVYRTGVLKKVGGFDVGNLTEDFEIGLRLRAAGYDIKADDDSITYTSVPGSIAGLFEQRVRWAHGFFMNMFRYRRLFFNKRHSLLGTFQLPLMALSLVLLLASTSIILYSAVSSFYRFIVHSLTIEGYLKSLFTGFPSITQMVFGLDLRLMFLVYVPLGAGLVFLLLVHGRTKERFWPSTVFLLLALPYFIFLQWLLGFFSYVRKVAGK